MAKAELRVSAAAIRRVTRLPKLGRRAREAHKGDFGRVLIVGGSRGMIGAPALAAQAALRSGAGLASVACPGSIQLSVAALCPCATSIELPEVKTGTIDPRAALRLLRSEGLLTGPSASKVVAGGPGLGRGDARFERGLLELWLAVMRAGIALVLDADALNALHPSTGRRADGWDKARWRRTVITPHPGELARMHGTTSPEIQSARPRWAIRTAQQMAGEIGPDETRPVVVLKGAGTVVTDGRRIYVNRTGNPGMATGGSGDVLTGVIAALIGQGGLSCFDAAVLGAHVHGLAGDLAAKELGEVSLTAADLVNYLPRAFRKVI